MNATVSVICYKSRPQKNGEYPLTLRITKNGQRKYQYLGISVELKHWDFQKNRPIVFQKVCKFQFIYFCNRTVKNNLLWNLHLSK